MKSFLFSIVGIFILSACSSSGRNFQLMGPVFFVQSHQSPFTARLEDQDFSQHLQEAFQDRFSQLHSKILNVYRGKTPSRSLRWMQDQLGPRDHGLFLWIRHRQHSIAVADNALSRMDTVEIFCQAFLIENQKILSHEIFHLESPQYLQGENAYSSHLQEEKHWKELAEALTERIYSWLLLKNSTLHYLKAMDLSSKEPLR